MVTTDEIKKLRDETGISIMQVKKALEEAGGNREKALVILRKRSGDSALKKADRALGSGAIQAYIHNNALVGAMVELSCETDFVSKNEEFKTLARNIAMQVAATRPEYIRYEDVSDAEKSKSAEVFEKEIVGKPKEMQQKILEGKLKSYFSERVLLDQPYVKDPEQTVRQLIEGAIHKFGEKIEVSRFSYLRVGSR